MLQVDDIAVERPDKAADVSERARQIRDFNGNPHEAVASRQASLDQ